ncbi:MAG: hypothetical protein AB1765_12860 [Candidatus Hydrogenedentota bacterium]
MDTEKKPKDREKLFRAIAHQLAYLDTPQDIYQECWVAHLTNPGMSLSLIKWRVMDVYRNRRQKQDQWISWDDEAYEYLTETIPAPEDVEGETTDTVWLEELAEKVKIAIRQKIGRRQLARMWHITERQARNLIEAFV